MEGVDKGRFLTQIPLIVLWISLLALVTRLSAVYCRGVDPRTPGPDEAVTLRRAPLASDKSSVAVRLRQRRSRCWPSC